jgi:hypothetical protein
LSKEKIKFPALRRRSAGKIAAPIEPQWLIEYETESELEDENAENWDAPIDPGPEFPDYGELLPIL